MSAVAAEPGRLSRPGATSAKPWGRRPYIVQGVAYVSLDALAAELSRRRDQHALDADFDAP